MSIFDGMKRWLRPTDRQPVSGSPVASDTPAVSGDPVAPSTRPQSAAPEQSRQLAEEQMAAREPGVPPVAVLSKGSITDLKRMSKFLASVGVESQLVMPPGGCGT